MQWPDASAEDMSRQVTDRIEKKLQEIETLEATRSMTVAGQSLVYVDLQSTVKARDVQPTWQRVRHMVDDIRAEFPQGMVGPFYNDRFGDVFGNIYAFIIWRISGSSISPDFDSLHSSGMPRLLDWFTG